MIPFNKPFKLSKVELTETFSHLNKFSGDGPITAECTQLIENQFNINKCLMTTSCTHALEMAYQYKAR
jgi:dTDP-4-amino-4,6-dideoxygalactose transaminase